MTKFKVGDRVRAIKNSSYSGTKIGNLGTVVRIGEDSMPWKVDWDHGFKNDPCSVEHIEQVQSAPNLTGQPVKFILHLVASQKPAELFSTLKEAEARIKELDLQGELQHDSIKVYEIAKTYDVKLETRVVFGPKVTLTAKKPAKQRVTKKAA